MKKSNLIATGAAFLVALVAITGVSISTYASSNDNVDTPSSAMEKRIGRFNFKNLTEEELAEKKAFWEEQREKVQVAIESKNYSAWLEAVGEDCPMAEKINADNFDRFVEMHSLREQAFVIAEELGIEKNGFGHKAGSGRGMGRR